jgi:hypothetical protein
MALKIFVFTIIIFSLYLTKIDISKEEEKKNYKNIPQMTFEDSTMYDINEKEVTQIVQSRQALNYKDRDELYDGTIILKKPNNSSDTISAEYIIKKANIYKLYQNVHLNSSDNVQLQTDYLQYDELSQVASNNVVFQLTYNSSTLDGKNFYFDGLNDIIKADNSHFIIKQEDLAK